MHWYLCLTLTPALFELKPLSNCSDEHTGDQQSYGMCHSANITHKRFTPLACEFMNCCHDVLCATGTDEHLQGVGSCCSMLYANHGRLDTRPAAGLTWAPRPTNSSTIALPMPRVPPVMRHFLPDPRYCLLPGAMPAIAVKGVLKLSSVATNGGKTNEQSCRMLTNNQAAVYASSN